MNRAGDWNCRLCQHLNFQRRELCQRCGEARDHYGISFGGSSSFGFSTGPDVRPGDWYCSFANCGTHNFASRSTCFKCGASKDEPASAGSSFHGTEMLRMRGFGFGGGGSTSRSAGWKSGDWICTRSGCNEHNFASRTECYRCNAPRDSSATNSSH
ncbi:RNA-binding protein involved in heterochromatin assembly dri1 [Mercurialis annua]|uniref:RNA-binding protein involved in heterochromatin assembly dri1 n=1 Tax=Mercurialis annua TaxID=3986 RepID=UPI00215E1920|nr:RNA-binding protein involved in heterochromatin assembly dri1 [Mercurialis annua]XP_050213197.1 RNA-binding protein involved in heterochromatin assembly dri1 [Mercurialis annua]